MLILVKYCLLHKTVRMNRFADVFVRVKCLQVKNLKKERKKYEKQLANDQSTEYTIDLQSFDEDENNKEFYILNSAE